MIPLSNNPISDKQSVPAHIAVIMDGNRRWAKEHGFPQLSGHEKVANETLEILIEHAAKKGIRYLTFWAWSTENWQRNKFEINGIMRLFRHVILNRWQRLHEKGVRVCTIGDISKFPADIQTSLNEVVEQTKNNTTITTIFALNYGGRDEIIRSIKKMNDALSEFRFKKSNLNEASFAAFLDTASMPDPDIIVRPGGEKRLSGFMLWQSEYSELFFYDWYMPEFTPRKLDEILEEFARRQRRFGK